MRCCRRCCEREADRWPVVEARVVVRSANTRAVLLRWCCKERTVTGGCVFLAGGVDEESISTDGCVATARRIKTQRVNPVRRVFAAGCILQERI